jgi:hypothetical protein
LTPVLKNVSNAFLTCVKVSGLTNPSSTSLLSKAKSVISKVLSLALALFHPKTSAKSVAKAILAF